MIIKKTKIFLKTFLTCYKEHKLAITILAILGFIGAVLEGVGINALIPLFSFIVDGGNGDDFISQFIEKFFLFFNIDFRLKYLLIFIGLLFVFKFLFLILIGYIRTRITTNYEEYTRKKMFRNFFYTNWPYLLRQKIGYLQTVLMINIENSASVLSCTSSLIVLLVNILVYAIIAININFRITLYTIGLSGFIFFIFFPFIRKLRSLSYGLENINRRIGHHINENILGIKTIKAMSAVEQVIKDASKNFQDLRIIKIKTQLINSLVVSILQPISIIFILIMFAISYKTSDFSLISFAVVVYLVKLIFSNAQSLQKIVLAFNASIPYFKSISDYAIQFEKNKEDDAGVRKFKFNNNLEFNNVHFSYGNKRNVLEGVNFKIKRGEMVGMIGSSGAGKTTVVDLILRLFNPTKGKILLDEKDINKINLEEWRKNIGYVSQDIFLMNNTIESNIKFYNSSITDKDMINAAKMANIYDFIKKSSAGFSTIIGERGIQLSAGQRQRVVIARVLAKKPKILILDEATSALDNESEDKIQKVIEKLKGKVTVFVIAHRLSTVIDTDRLLVLENGKIIEQGRPQDLLEDKKTYFYKMYNIRK